MSVVANVAINVDAANAIQQLNRVKAALQSAIAPLLTITAALGAVKAGLDVAFERTAAEQRLKNITSSAGEFNAAMALAADTSQKFGLTQTESTKALADVYSRLKGVGFGLQETGQIYQGFNAIAQQSGLAGEEAAGAFFQLSQALGKGKLNGDEFVIVAERMPQLLDAIAQTTGKSRGELTQMAQDGQITSQVLYAALSGAAAASGELNGKLTAQQSAFNALRQASDQLLNSLGQAFAPAVIAGAQLLTEAFIALQSKMPQIVAAANQLLAPLVAIGSVVLPIIKAGFQGLLDNIQPIIQTIAFWGTFVGILKAIALATATWTAATNALANAQKVAAVAATALQAILNPASLAKVAVAIAGAAAASYAIGKAMDDAAGKTAKTNDESAKLQANIDEVLKKYSSLPPTIDNAKGKQKELNAELQRAKDAISDQTDLRTAQLDNEIKLKEASGDIAGTAEATFSKIKATYDQRVAALVLERDYGRITKEQYDIKSRIVEEERKGAEIGAQIKANEESRKQTQDKIAELKERENEATKALADNQAAVAKAVEQQAQIATKTLSMQLQTAEINLSIADSEEAKAAAAGQVTRFKIEQAKQEYETAIQAKGATESYIRAAEALKDAKIQSFELAANMARSAAEAERIRNLGNAYSGTEFGGAYAVSNVVLQQQGRAIWDAALKKAMEAPISMPLIAQKILTEAQMQISNLQLPYRQAQQAQKYESSLAELEKLGIRAPAATPGYVQSYRASQMSMQAPQVNITTGPVTQMGGTNYVTMSDLQQATSTAARQGANLALSQLQNSPSVRRSIGVAR